MLLECGDCHSVRGWRRQGDVTIITLRQQMVYMFALTYQLCIINVSSVCLTTKLAQPWLPVEEASLSDTHHLCLCSNLLDFIMRNAGVMLGLVMAKGRSDQCSTFWDLGGMCSYQNGIQPGYITFLYQIAKLFLQSLFHIQLKYLQCPEYDTGTFPHTAEWRYHRP